MQDIIPVRMDPDNPGAVHLDAEPLLTLLANFDRSGARLDDPAIVAALLIMP